MKYDIFLSICQTEIDGYLPSEKKMFENFFSQVQLADDLGFGTAWVAETHLSCAVQKQNANAVIPHFKGEIGLNTDILQLAHIIFARTQRLHVGSAIRNILCDGGPVAHAEAVKTGISLHAFQKNNENRKINIGFASGRFEFSNRPYGIVPRNDIEKKAWSVVKHKVLHQATEIFLRLINGEVLASLDIEKTFIRREDFRSDKDWIDAGSPDEYWVKPFWNFEKVAVLPRETPLELLDLTLGSHDAALQVKANRYRPVKTFNLSVTPQKIIEETHMRMRQCYHKDGGPWQRDYMPRTVLLYVDESSEKAKNMAERAWQNYWMAMEGTLDSKKVQEAISNTIAGTPQEVRAQIREKYHPDDRLMLWFDFNNHDNEYIRQSMKLFMEKCI